MLEDDIYPDHTSETQNGFISGRFQSLKTASDKQTFDSNVKRYREIINYTARTGDTSFCSPYVTPIIRHIDQWTSIFFSTLWDFEKTPFVLRHWNEEFVSNDVVKNFYELITKKIELMLQSYRSNFNIAFQQALKSSIETGISAITVEMNKDEDIFVLNSIPPEDMQFRWKKNELVEVVTRIYETFENPSTLALSREWVYHRFKKIDENNWAVYEQRPHWNKDKEGVYGHVTKLGNVDYTPVYILRFNVAIGKKIGQGKGIDVLSLLIESNNIGKTLDETASRLLDPIVFKKEGSITKDRKASDLRMGWSPSPTMTNYDPKLKATVYTTNGNVDMPMHQFQFQNDHSLARERYAQHMQELQNVLAQNKSFLEKGIARMTATETMTRVNSDKTLLTYLSATFVDEFLTPFIKSAIRFASKDEDMKEINEIFGDEWEIDDVDVILQNQLTRESADEVLQKSMSGIQVLSALLNMENQLKGQVDLTSLISTVNDLFNLDVKFPQQQASNALIDSLQAFASENIVDNNRA